MPDLVPDGLDEMDVYADEFERLGRAAGAELRSAPPATAERAVVRSAGRRRAALTVGAIVGGLAVAIAGIGLIFIASDRSPTPGEEQLLPSGPGWIAYEVGAGSPRQVLFLVRPDGTDARPLVPDLSGGDQSKPDWSPDGRRIVFTMPVTGGESLWTVDVDGTDPSLLVDCTGECVYLDDPSWSPDGTKVAYARMTRRGEDTFATLEQADVDSGEIDVLLEAAPLDIFAGPRWSPDGRSLVLEVAHRDGPTLDAEVTGATLTVVELGANPPDVRALSGAGTSPVTPDWSPSGETIVFAAPPSPDAAGNDLFLMSPDGDRPVRLTFLADEGGDAAFPSFDHTGRRVIFSAAESTGPQVLASVDVDGENFTKIGSSTISATHARP